MTALSDINVVDLTIARAGPTAVRQLGDWGANVIRVERPGGRGELSGSYDSSDYMNLHRNKRVVTLDLKSDEGRKVFERLIADADVVVENYRPPVKHRLGIDYEALSAINPRLIYASISGFGQDGPYSDKGAVDQIIQGMGGLMSITGDEHSAPTRAGIALSDLAAGHQLAIGILVALHERQTSGQGQWVQLSLIEAMISFLDFQATRYITDGEVPTPAGNHHPSNSPMGTFRASDGHLNVAASTNELFERFCKATGATELLDDPDFAEPRLRVANRTRLEEAIQAVLTTRTKAEWTAVLDEAGIPCGPVNTIDEVFADPQVEHLAMGAEVDHASRGKVKILRHPVRMSRTRSEIHSASPMPGQHTDEVLGELGFDEAEITRLREAGVV